MPGKTYRTPDKFRGKEFVIDKATPHSIFIVPQRISINKEAFLKTVEYLRHNHHTENNPAKILSNNDPKLSGPLCKVSRDMNKNVRCINYIIPILRAKGIVGFNAERPNTTWICGSKNWRGGRS